MHHRTPVVRAGSVLAVTQASTDQHLIALGVVAAIVAILFLVHLWKRRRLRRERS